MVCRATRDAQGTTYSIPAAAPATTPHLKHLQGLPAIEVWWSRSFQRGHAEETLIIRQEYEDRATADVLELTLGQTYDLIEALNKAIENS